MRALLLVAALAACVDRSRDRDDHGTGIPEVRRLHVTAPIVGDPLRVYVHADGRIYAGAMRTDLEQLARFMRVNDPRVVPDSDVTMPVEYSTNCKLLAADRAEGQYIPPAPPTGVLVIASPSASALTLVDVVAATRGAIAVSIEPQGNGQMRYWPRVLVLDVDIVGAGDPRRVCAEVVQADARDSVQDLVGKLAEVDRSPALVALEKSMLGTVREDSFDDDPLGAPR